MDTLRLPSAAAPCSSCLARSTAPRRAAPTSTPRATRHAALASSASCGCSSRLRHCVGSLRRTGPGGPGHHPGLHLPCSGQSPGREGTGLSRCAAKAELGSAGEGRGSVVSAADGAPSSSSEGEALSSQAASPRVQDRLALLELYTSGSDDEEGAPAGPGRSDPPPPSPQVGSNVDASGGDGPMTVAEKLQSQLKVVTRDNVLIPIGRKKLVSKIAKPVTEAERRNLKRAVYLENVGQRNDSTFFFIVAFSVFVPPVVILAIAWTSGYLEFLT